jgi:hypothetical protein
MMLVVAVGLGAVIGWWAWRVAGAIAAVVAVGLFAFDPNFLGHGPLVKNDVAVSLVTVAVMYVVWRLGERVTWPRAVGLGLLCGAGLTVKLSAIVLGPIVTVMLVGRAVFGREWVVVGGRRVAGAGRKVVVAMSLCAAAAVVSYAVIWAAYGFRYAASPEPGFRIDMREIVRLAALKSYYARDPNRRPSEEELAGWDPGPVARAAIALNDHHALPEAWLGGVLFIGRNAIGEKSYLNGHITYGGTWYYFLEAMAVKSPTATVVGGVLAAVWLGMTRRRGGGGEATPFPQGWTLACLVVPGGVLLVASFFAEMNLGVRYVFPVYPFLFVLLGAAAAAVWPAKLGRVVVGCLAVALVGESLWAYPNYVAFFNGPAGGARGGLGLLGDSNLDWGQDLPAVAEWQRRHPDDALYLAYFGMDDPASWGIRYHNLPGGYTYGPKREWPTGDCWMLISATNLQGIYFRQDLYDRFRNDEPEEVLGGTIYVYRVRGP